MSMKILVFFGIVFGAGLFWLLNVAYKRTNHYREDVGQCKKFRQIPSNLEVVNLGSNHALYGFRYEGLEKKGFNFALGPQCLFYDFNILKTFSGHLKKGCTVLIALPPCVFCFGEKGCDNSKYYHFLPSEMIPRFSWRRKIGDVYFPLLLKPKKVRFLIEDSPQTSPKENTKDNAEKTAVVRRDAWMRQFGLSDMVSGDIPEELRLQFDQTTRIVSEMIDFCLNQGFKPVLVIPPVSEALRELLGGNYLDVALYDNIKKANVRNVPVLDYLRDDRFSDFSLYRNSDFLTESGSIFFTQAVFMDLESLGCFPEYQDEKL
jgi:hypothetical protein